VAEKFTVSARIKSMSAAVSGMKIMLREEHNARIHLLATACVVVAAIVLGAGKVDWLVLTLVISLVWITEAINTAIENLADKLCPEHDPLIGKAKDVACLAVALASVCAVVCGVLVFVPLLLAL
jgi:diacylglycerol kinase (ATP)